MMDTQKPPAEAPASSAPTVAAEPGAGTADLATGWIFLAEDNAVDLGGILQQIQRSYPEAVWPKYRKQDRKSEPADQVWEAGADNLSSCWSGKVGTDNWLEEIIEYIPYKDAAIVTLARNAELPPEAPQALSTLAAELLTWAERFEKTLVGRAAAQDTVPAFEVLFLGAGDGKETKAFRRMEEIGRQWLDSVPACEINLRHGRLLASLDCRRWLMVAEPAQIEDAGTFVRSVLYACLVRRHKLLRIRAVLAAFRDPEQRNNPDNTAVNLRRVWEDLERLSRKGVVELEQAANNPVSVNRENMSRLMGALRVSQTRTIAAWARMELHHISARTNLDEINAHIGSYQARRVGIEGESAASFRTLLTEGFLGLEKEFQPDMDYARAIREHAQTVESGIQYCLQETEARFARLATVVVAGIGAVSLYNFIKASLVPVLPGLGALPPALRIGLNFLGLFTVFFLVALLMHRLIHSYRLFRFMDWVSRKTGGVSSHSPAGAGDPGSS